MQKLIEVNAAKEFASTFLADPILKMAVNSVLDHAPAAKDIDVPDQWIPVTERLPDEDTTVLTYRASGIEVEPRRSNGWDYDDLTPYPVTHWMPTPEPPKEENK